MGLLLLLIGLALGLGTWFAKSRFLSFRAQNPAYYASNQPTFDIVKAFDGKVACDGVVYDYFGRVNGRFTAVMDGTWEGDKGEITEDFTYDSGRVQIRHWSLHLGDGGTFTATAPDIIGTGIGQQSGSTVRLAYKIQLPAEVGGYVLDVIDWMYLLENGTIINRSEFRKFGIKVAELVASLKRMD